MEKVTAPQLDIFGNVQKDPARKMEDFFIVPPFSILDSTNNKWQARKKRWDILTKDNGESREGTLFKDPQMHDYDYFRGKAKVEARLGYKVTKEEYYKSHFKGGMKSVSIFDSVLTELLVKWFSEEGHKVLDPFSGSITRGFISTYLKREYTGFEIREAQIKANKIAAESSEELDIIPKYIHDTSEKISEYTSPNEFDFVMSCPPYLWLEVYSDGDHDLSNMDEESFFKSYSNIIKGCYTALKDNRFAAFVISEVRDKNTGRYVSFVPNTVRIFEEAGFIYYNEIILINSVGTLPMRAGKSMNASRKIGRRHQNVLIFYKGDISKIKENYSEIIPKNTYYEGA
jgi:DNA modification methylase